MFDFGKEYDGELDAARKYDDLLRALATYYHQTENKELDELMTRRAGDDWQAAKHVTSPRRDIQANIRP